MDLQNLKKLAEKELGEAIDLKKLDSVYKKYLGKNGDIARVFVSLKDISIEERKEIGKSVNLIKNELEKLLKERTAVLKVKLRNEKIKAESIDITRPSQKFEAGHLHPITLIKTEAEEIFQSMGFEIASGPDVETEWYNFDALNIPANHPARDMWDTFWLKPENARMLLRTHTSPVQVRYMQKNNPPIKIIVPGRVFRHEATDSSHEFQFQQLEGLMVDESVSVGNFKYIIQEFLKKFFKTDVIIRLRPSFFPFTEPSFEIDVKRKGMPWLELMGAGMVHPNVFKSAGLNPNGLQGFAFGVGLDRLTMIKYKINDIRLFRQNDLRFLKQF